MHFNYLICITIFLLIQNAHLENKLRKCNIQTSDPNSEKSLKYVTHHLIKKFNHNGITDYQQQFLYILSEIYPNLKRKQEKISDILNEADRAQFEKIENFKLDILENLKKEIETKNEELLKDSLEKLSKRNKKHHNDDDDDNNRSLLDHLKKKLNCDKIEKKSKNWQNQIKNLKNKIEHFCSKPLNKLCDIVQSSFDDLNKFKYAYNYFVKDQKVNDDNLATWNGLKESTAKAINEANQFLINWQKEMDNLSNQAIDKNNNTIQKQVNDLIDSIKLDIVKVKMEIEKSIDENVVLNESNKSNTKRDVDDAFQQCSLFVEDAKTKNLETIMNYSKDLKQVFEMLHSQIAYLHINLDQLSGQFITNSGDQL